MAPGATYYLYQMSTLEVRLTRDGTPTIYTSRYDATYHSMYGAMEESLHVFIQAGLHHRLSLPFNPPLKVFEMGFGTGLNALLTWIEAENWGISIDYTAIELHPLPESMWRSIPMMTVTELPVEFEHLHTSPWGFRQQLSPHFSLLKLESDLLDTVLQGPFDLIFYDAFGPATQPELWTKATLEKVCSRLDSHGVFVTYCSKGDVRRSLIGCGLDVQKHAGPPGKREMLRAIQASSPVAPPV